MSLFDFGQVNNAQKEAVLQTDGPVLIIAGPGTGKTYTLVKRISYLVKVKGVNPNEIMKELNRQDQPASIDDLLGDLDNW